MTETDLNKLKLYIKTIPQFLKTHRISLELTQRAFARKYGVTVGYIAQLEAGHYAKPMSFLKTIKPDLTKTEKDLVKYLLMKEIAEQWEN